MKDKKHDDQSDKTLLFIIVSIFVMVWLNKQIPIWVKYALEHKFLFGFIFSSFITSTYMLIKWRVQKNRSKKNISKLLETETDDSFYIGVSDQGKDVFLPESARTKHTQIVGTTSAGKTESVIIPWAVQDIKKGRGFILIDGKSDSGLLDKLYAYCIKYKRSKDFRLMSLVNIDESHTYNPLANGTPEEVTERVFSSFEFENEYYKNIQYEFLKQTLIILNKAKIEPTFVKLIDALSNPSLLYELALKSKNVLLIEWASKIKTLSRETLEERTSGLINQLGHFATGDTAKLFNAEHPSIDLEKAMREGLILYFQLPVLKTPTLGKATGKMLLQNLQSAISSRHLDQDKNFPLFSVFLDDFSEYLTPSFVSLLNKSRSANVGIVFAHQALGDLAALGDAIKNTILTNSNVKVFMRTNENESAEYFSKTCGTTTTTKSTERYTDKTFGAERTGEASVREVEEFKYHPNVFKNEIGTGEAVMIVPFQTNTVSVKLRLDMLEDLLSESLPKIFKADPYDLKSFTNRSVNRKPEVQNKSTLSEVDDALKKAAV